MTWIKCSDKPGGMPRWGKWVNIVFRRGDARFSSVAALNGEKTIWEDGLYHEQHPVKSVTHFMYLPPLPGEEENDG
ncbi:hypothetical protein LCGC14_3162560 [marine sediment metagenome]|uniref:DUF551 domain-containing protein n=1 Tax=marine sediment metagenome TaxID=412755 RepID=A0A0F8WEZ4_9ZZZZ